MRCYWKGERFEISIHFLQIQNVKYSRSRPLVGVEPVLSVEQKSVQFASQIPEIRVGPPHLGVVCEGTGRGHEQRSAGRVNAVIEMVAVLPRPLVELIDGHQPLAEVELLEDAIGAGEEQD